MVATGVLDVLRTHAAESESARQLHPASVGALRDAGLLRLLVPARCGGDERGLDAMVDAVVETGEGCAATSWVLMVLAAHDWILGSFPEEAQDEVYASGPDTIVPGSLAPAGELSPVDGGWRVTGRWPFASGAIHGAWYLVGSVEPAVGERPRLVHLVLPRADVTIDDTWFPLGLRGTGSADVVAEDVFVPEHRVVDSGELLAGRSPWAERHETSLYRTPILPGLAAHVAACCLAIAQPALTDAVERLGGQDDRYSGGVKRDRPGMQMRFAEATTELRSARLLLDDTLVVLDESAGANDDKARRAKAKFQANYVTEVCRRAVDRVFTAAGARAAFDGSRLQQAHRDLDMATQHAVADFDGSAQAYGRTILGMSPGAHPL